MKLGRTLFTALLLSITPQAAMAANLIDANIFPFPLPSGVTGAYLYGMGDNGLVGTGIANDGSGVRWVSDGTSCGSYAHLLPFLPGDISTLGLGASDDGTVIVGASSDGITYRAFRWISDGTATGGIIHSLGFLPGDTVSYATGVSNNGLVVTGHSNNNDPNEAFRWVSDGTLTGGTMHALGFLAGQSDSSAFGINATGSVIVGTSGTEAFRWVSDGTATGGTMHSLGLLSGGTISRANAVNADGTIVVGYADDGVNTLATRWISDGTATGGTLESLGNLPGGSYGVAYGISADGRVITGVADDGFTAEAFLWTEENGMKSLRQILTDAGVDLTGWTSLANDEGRTFVSADGNRIMGSGYYNGEETGYLMTVTALTTPEQLEESLAAAPLSGQQGSQAVVSGVGQSLTVARNALSMYIPRPASSRQQNARIASADPTVLSGVEPAAGGDMQRRAPYGHAFYALGDLGIGHNDNFSNYGLSGATGLLIGINDSLALGAGLVGSHSRIETSLGGNSTVEAWGVSTMISYEPASGFRLYGTASAVPLNISSKRNYVNGGGIDSSTGETDGMGYGVAARAGWSLPLDEKKAVMPYGEVQWSKTKIDAYTEQGGGIPAAYASQDNDSWTSRLGLEYSQAVTDDVTFRTRAAWGHRYGDGNGVVTTAMSITQTISATPGDRDWAEGGVGAVWRVSNKTSLSFDLSGRAGQTGEPAVSLLFGMTMGF